MEHCLQAFFTFLLFCIDLSASLGLIPASVEYFPFIYDGFCVTCEGQNVCLLSSSRVV